jgi:hypothetical protein
VVWCCVVWYGVVWCGVGVVWVWCGVVWCGMFAVGFVAPQVFVAKRPGALGRIQSWMSQNNTGLAEEQEARLLMEEMADALGASRPTWQGVLGWPGSVPEVGTALQRIVQNGWAQNNTEVEREPARGLSLRDKIGSMECYMREEGVGRDNLRKWAEAEGNLVVLFGNQQEALGKFVATHGPAWPPGTLDGAEGWRGRAKPAPPR